MRLIQLYITSSLWNLIYFLFSAIIVKIIAEKSGPSVTLELNEFKLMNAVILTLITGNLINYCIITAKKTKVGLTYLRQISKILFLCISVCVLIGAEYVGMDKTTIILLLTCSYCLCKNYYYHAYLASVNNLGRFYNAQLVGIVTSLFYYLLVYKLNSVSTSTILSGYTFSSLVTVLFLHLKYERKIKSKFRYSKVLSYIYLTLKHRPVALIIGLPGIIMPYLYLVTRQKLDNLYGSYFAGSVDAAITIWLLAFSLITTTLVPILVRNAVSLKQENIEKVCVLMIVSAIFISLILGMVAEEILILLYSDSYRAGKEVLHLLVKLYPIQIAFFLYGSVLLSNSKFSTFVMLEVCQISAYCIGLILIEHLIVMPFYLSATIMSILTLALIVSNKAFSYHLKISYTVLNCYLGFIWYDIAHDLIIY